MWGEWGNWTTCSETCGEGTKSRTRKCDNPKPSGGGNKSESGGGNAIWIVGAIAIRSQCPKGFHHIKLDEV